MRKTRAASLKPAPTTQRRRRTKYQAFLEAVPDMMLRLNRAGIFLEFKPSADFEPLLPPESFLGQTIHAVLPAPIARLSLHHIERALHTGEMQTFEYPLAVNGDERHFEARVVAAGKDEVVVVVREITDRVRAEKALQMFQVCIEQASDAVFWLDRDAHYTYVNAEACRSLGYTRDELLDMHLWDVDPVFPRERYDREWEQFQEGELGTQRIETWHRRKDGGMFPVEVSYWQISLGDTDLHVAYVRDITERRKAEEALRQSEEKYRSLADYSVQGIVLFQDAHVVFVNPAMCNMLGYAAEEFLSMPLGQLLGIVHPEDRAASATRVQRLVQGRARPYRAEYRAMRKDGSVRWLEAFVNPIEYAGRPAHLATILDITERKQAEAALHQSQKMESLGILAGGIAHDFNNLLVAMIGQMSIALAKLPAENPARNHVEKAVKAAERAADLTRQLLAYSGRGQFEIRPIHMNTLIQENLHLFEVALPKNVHLASDLADALPLIEADAGQLQQVIMNLIINGAEAIGERPGTVRVVTRPHDLRAEEAAAWQLSDERLPAGLYVMLEVRDDGKGMDADTLSKIFDPFFTTKFTGRGLGLAAVLGIVRGHRGGLQVSSQPERGTAFQLIFPATAAAPPDEVATTAVQEVKIMRRLILIIDDEEPVREAVTDILELEGLEALAAPNGAAGIELYRERQAEIDLVLLDLSMPGLSGEETFQRLREINPDVRVVLSSGYTQTEATQRFAEHGWVGFIQKPYDVQTLMAAVRRYLD
jgi:PAS domain S-box-containing protein